MREIQGTLRRRLGRRLRQFREALHLTQEELAARSGLAPKYLGEVERGRANISLDRVERLAAALEVDATELLEDDGAQPDAALARLLRRAGVLFRRTRSGERRLMIQLLEDVAKAYGKKRRE